MMIDMNIKENQWQTNWRLSKEEGSLPVSMALICTFLHRYFDHKAECAEKEVAEFVQFADNLCFLFIQKML